MSNHEVTAASPPAAALAHTSPGEAARNNGRGKLVTFLAVSALVVTLPIVWFGFLSPQDSAVTVRLPSAAVNPSAPLVVAGSVTPAEAGRTVELQVRGDAGAWETLTSVDTTSDGGYRAEVDAPETPGSIEYRVVATAKGRQQPATSNVAALRVLTPSTLTVDTPARLRTDKASVVKGMLSPAGQRAVVVETSSNGGSTWVELTAGQSTADGSFRLKLTPATRFDGLLRVHAAATDTDAEAVTEATSVLVEDYIAAGRFYLKVIRVPNEKGQSVEVNDFALAAADYAEYAAAAKSAAEKLEGYKHWPKAAVPHARGVTASLLIRSDAFRRMSRAAGFAEANQIWADMDAADAKYDQSPVLLRATLGLPERSN